MYIIIIKKCLWEATTDWSDGKIRQSAIVGK